jgi:exodeoxyribonuclease VII small subunit
MTETSALTFEQAFAELERVVAQLEGGDLTLEQSLALFERGTALAQLCERRLSEAEQKVLQLSAAPDGAPALTSFGGVE